MKEGQGWEQIKAHYLMEQKDLSSQPQVIVNFKALSWVVLGFAWGLVLLSKVTLFSLFSHKKDGKHWKGHPLNYFPNWLLSCQPKYYSLIFQFKDYTCTHRCLFPSITQLTDSHEEAVCTWEWPLFCNQHIELSILSLVSLSSGTICTFTRPLSIWS